METNPNFASVGSTILAPELLVKYTHVRSYIFRILLFIFPLFNRKIAKDFSLVAVGVGEASFKQECSSVSMSRETSSRMSKVSIDKHVELDIDKIFMRQRREFSVRPISLHGLL